MTAPTVAMMVPILGGTEHYEANFNSAGIERTEDSVLRIDIAGIILDAPAKKAAYGATIFFKGTNVPKTVVMEDITDEAPLQLMNDQNATLNAAHTWRQTSTYRELSDPRFKWTQAIDNSVRVYRFTITLTDGRTLEYRQATMYGSYTKEALRKGMGSNY